MSVVPGLRKPPLFFLMIFIFSIIVGFTEFCQFSIVQQSDPATHIYIHSFSHIILQPPHLKGISAAL